MRHVTTTDSAAILKQLAVLTAEIASVRTALDVQFKRMAAMQAELDLLPTARRRRDVMRTSPPRAAHNGNGNGNGRSHG